MKFISSLCALLAFTACSLHQDFKEEKLVKRKKVPQQVITAFEARHPGVDTNFHEQEKDEVETFEAHYMTGDKENSERFSKTGELLETEEEIDFKEIESSAQRNIKLFLEKEDSDSRISKVQKAFSKEFTGYELKVRTNKSRTTLMEYFFKLDGSFSHKEELKLKAIPTLY